jgi:hypothetical protein
VNKDDVPVPVELGCGIAFIIVMAAVGLRIAMWILDLHF